MKSLKDISLDYQNIRLVLLAVLLGLLPIFPPLLSPNFWFMTWSLLFVLVILDQLYLPKVFSSARKRFLPGLPWTAFLVLSGISLIYAPSIEPAIKKWLILAGGLCLGWFGASLTRRQQVIIGTVIAIVGLIVAMKMIYMRSVSRLPTEAEFDSLYGYLSPKLKSDLWDSLKQGRALGPTGNPNHSAGYLLFPLLWWCGILRWGRVKVPVKIFCLTAIFVILFTIYITFSRTGLMLLFCGILGWIFYETYRVKPRLAFGAVISIAGIVILGFLAAVFLLDPDKHFGGRLLVTVTIKARLEFWRGALLCIKDNPISGCGLASFNFLYPLYRLPGGIESRYVHNFLLEAYQETGLLGFFVWCWWTIVVVRLVFRGLLTKCSNIYDGVVLISSLAVGLSLLQWSIDFPNNIALFMLIFGWHLGVLNGSAEKDEKIESKLNYKSIGVLVLGGILWWGIIYRPFQGEIAYNNGFVLLRENNTKDALGWYYKSIKYVPWAGIYHQHYGKTLFAEGYVKEAIEELEIANILSPQAFMAADLAQVYWLSGYRQDALENIRTAIRRHPVSPEYHKQLAGYLKEVGMEQEADEELKLADSLDIEYGTAKLRW